MKLEIPEYDVFMVFDGNYSLQENQVQLTFEHTG